MKSKGYFRSMRDCYAVDGAKVPRCLRVVMVVLLRLLLLLLHLHRCASTVIACVR